MCIPSCLNYYRKHNLHALVSVTSYLGLDKRLREREKMTDLSVSLNVSRKNNCHLVRYLCYGYYFYSPFVLQKRTVYYFLFQTTKISQLNRGIVYGNHYFNRPRRLSKEFRGIAKTSPIEASALYRGEANDNFMSLYGAQSADVRLF